MHGLLEVADQVNDESQRNPTFLDWRIGVNSAKCFFPIYHKSVALLY